MPAEIPAAVHFFKRQKLIKAGLNVPKPNDELVQSAGQRYPTRGVERAASPWPTLGIRSCRSFCSDLA